MAHLILWSTCLCCLPATDLIIHICMLVYGCFFLIWSNCVIIIQWFWWQAYLTEFLQTLSTQVCYSMFSAHHNAAETQVLRAININLWPSLLSLLYSSRHKPIQVCIYHLCLQLDTVFCKRKSVSSLHSFLPVALWSFFFFPPVAKGV